MSEKWKKNNSQLVKLYIQKHRLENKINQIIDETRWKLTTILLSICVLLVSISIRFYDASLKGELKIFSKTEYLIWSIILLVWFAISSFLLIKTEFLFYYRLPRYRSKMAQIDHQIFEELAKIT